MVLFALTVFLGSFLLFQIQPLIGKHILPWFGGTPAVWTTCMLFFQAALLAGYTYAHGITLLDRKKQVYLHLTLIALSLLFLNIAPSGTWKPSPGDQPALRILLLLVASIGVPYLLLSSTAPLTQHWFAEFFPGKSPYRLYALSNASSLLALLTYPFLIEPRLPLGMQVWLWGGLFLLYLLCSSWCSIRLLIHRKGDDTAEAGVDIALEDREKRNGGIVTFLIWLALAACGSALLVSVTNQLCQEVAVVPFLWVLPLVLYLATFSICFNTARGYDRVLWVMLFAAALVPGCRILNLGVNVGLIAQIMIYLAVLFTCCMVCHGELARLKPHPRHLTGYYLAIAAGGALGGACIALGAPFFFTDFWEYPLTLAITTIVIIGCWYHQGVVSRMPHWLMVPIGGGVVMLIGFVAVWLVERQPGETYRTRNFYGVLRVLKQSESAGERLTLMHGRIAHGSQYSGGTMSSAPTSYYGPESGAGLALRLHPRRMNPTGSDRTIRAGIIGLGAGTLAAYGQKGDVFRFYEINPAVIDISERYFSYRRLSSATVEVVAGDARIMLERELQANTSQQYDVLLIDAFSSDAIPVHLLTKECFQLYRQHLAPGGLLLFHITNRFLDLSPVVKALAESSGKEVALISSPADNSKGIWKADWLVVTDNTQFMRQEAVRTKTTPLKPASLLWTDDFSGLWQVIK